MLIPAILIYPLIASFGPTSTLCWSLFPKTTFFCLLEKKKVRDWGILIVVNQQREKYHHDPFVNILFPIPQNLQDSCVFSCSQNIPGSCYEIPGWWYESAGSWYGLFWKSAPV